MEVYAMIEHYIGEKIREKRKELQLTQEQFALKCELDRTYIANVEAGKRNISARNLDKVIYALETTFSEFFSDYEREV